MMPVAEVKPGPALYVHGVFVASDPTGLNQARFEEVARKINEAAPDPIPQDASVETEAQGYALEAIWQFVPELKPREDDLTVLTPAQLEALLRRLGWVPPPEWQERKDSCDAEKMLAFLEAQAKASRTGVSLTYDKPEGFRFMRFHFATGFHPTLRTAIEAGMKEANHG